MKIKFLKDVAVNVMDVFDEIDVRSYRRGDEVTGVSTPETSQFFNLILPNGELLLDIPRESVTVIS